MPLRLARLPLFAVLAIVPLTACAGPCTLQVHDGWIRKPPADLPMLAGYARIVNDCKAPAVLVSASSPGFASVGLHATVVEDGISRMREVGEVPIAPGKTATFEPGGMHLLLMQQRTPLRAGDMVAIDFTLADGRSVRGSFEVKGPRAIK